MAFTEDHTVFFDTDEFAVSATFDGTTTINVIFDAEYQAALGDDEYASTSPEVWCIASDVPDPVGKTLVVNSTTYVIKVNQPDGTGQTRLILDEQ